MTFTDIIDKYCEQAFSERDKGTRFERLMQAWLLTVPQYQSILKNVWLWQDFPYRKDFGSGKDTGIDLVACTYDGNFWAVQCKCYGKSTQITKADVDTFLSTSEKRFRNEELQQVGFTHRLWISTTNNWSSEARHALENLSIAVNVISLSDLSNSPVDWQKLESNIHGEGAVLKERTVREHQQKAINLFHEHFLVADRGRLIMACGTGKTFTSLKIAENETAGKGLVLFLVPSIALLNQTLIEWSTFATKPIKPICICSDAEASKKKSENDDGGFRLEDLALPASTNAGEILRQYRIAQHNEQGGMTVFFSTYQSIGCVAEAQKKLNQEQKESCIFDLIICDEAHRTTGVALKSKNKKGGYDETAFIKVHDNEFIQGRKRLYMTATPRLYKDDVKDKAKEAEAYLCSMDDPAIYGEEVYRIGFGEAVEKDLLSDYKVLVLTAQESEIPPEFQKAVSNSNGEIEANDIAKLIGCINALSKRMIIDEELIKSSDPSLMHTAVAFCQTIKISKHITDVFNQQKDTYYETLSQEDRDKMVSVEAQHIDGSMGAATRQEKLGWLKATPTSGHDCRILTNVRCLSEGVDVPSLDAVMFLSSRNSQVDVVQSVGRVMRKAPGKKYGYIIIPVIIPSTMSPEEALDKSDCFAVVWTVLNALRAHDDRFNAEINKIELNRRPVKVNVDEHSIGKAGAGESDEGSGTLVTVAGEDDHTHIYVDGVAMTKAKQLELNLQYESLQNVIFARMVKKVGTRRYWELWAKDVASVAEQHIERIRKQVSDNGIHRVAFLEFITGLHKNLNPSVTEDEAIEMLAQHIITKPVFEALFENFSFVKSNPVSIAMQKMIDALQEEIPAKEVEVMARFYKSIAERVEGIDNAEGRQKIIVELYDKFFKSAFPKTVEKLGIVYTPVEVVDFIIHSVADVLKKEFNRTLSDENVHILDPFTGTGTFITRLLQSGLIKPKDLERKYQHELHANEIVLLAYYIASINIENVYHDLKRNKKEYQNFGGICLTDTFQLGESDDGDKLFSEMFSQNSERVIAQKKAPIRIIIGNPPYSVGQKSANDNAQNQSYPKLEKRIAETYAKYGTATSKKALYDSYIKALRWATDRLDTTNGGIIAFVSNAGWLDGNGMDGLRKCLADEFSSIYVFNLRGNCRTSGELRRKEGDNVFGLGSRTPIGITILVKKPGSTGTAEIRYHDIGDYLKTNDKFKIIKEYGSILNPTMELSSIVPNQDNDWINQRNDVFESFIPMAPEKKFTLVSESFFTTYSLGINTNRDVWVYNYAKQTMLENAIKMINTYNRQVNLYSHQKETVNDIRVDDVISKDLTLIKWSSSLIPQVERGIIAKYSSEYTRVAMYRPYCKQNLYEYPLFIHRMGNWEQLFPTPQTSNLVICTSSLGGKTFSALMSNTIADLHLLESGTQCFPLFWYEKQEQMQLSLFDKSDGEYIRRDGISDFAWQRARELYGPKTTKEDIFYYVYGLLHSPEYRQRFEADLTKMLPRIPFVETTASFKQFSNLGRQLAELHINYESVEAWPDLIVSGDGHNLTVEKMHFGKDGKMDDKRVIWLNSDLKVENIPLHAYDYVINGKSAIEWLMERYAVTKDKDSGIVNNANAWGFEHNNPKYILELLCRIVTVSMKTLELVGKLPHLEFS